MMKSSSLAHRRTLFVLFTVLAVLVITGHPAQAQEYGIIDDIDIVPMQQAVQVRIKFNRPAQLLGYTPKEMSRQMFIDLRLIGGPQNEFLVPPEQRLSIKPSQEVPLTLVTYREDGRQGARLELNFTHAVRYTVSANRDFRGVTITLPKAPQKKRVPGKAEPKASPEVESRVNKLMVQARKNMIEDRNYARAVTLYQQVLDEVPNSRSREALELLGLARERLGQNAQTVAIYKRYLQRYPEGEASERVRQRLMSLVTAALPEQKKLRTTSRSEDGADWQMFGSFSQFYLHDTIKIDDTERQTTTSALSTDLDLIAQRRSMDSNTRARVTLGHYEDRENDGETNTTRIGSLYIEHRALNLGGGTQSTGQGGWVRAGRQSGNRDGVLGRFDGVKAGYNLSKRVEATVVAGLPVEHSIDSPDSHRRFAGAALDLGPFADNWEFTLYGLEQQVDSLVDRRAAGGELRYFRPNLMVLSLLDYDTFYKELNIGMMLANWTLSNDLTINTTVDVRKTPLLTTRNALQGQLVEEIEQLRETYSDEAIYALARDRTAETRTLTVGLSQALTQRLRLSGDLSVSNTAATVASGGVEALPATDNEYFLNLQATGTGVLNGDDISTLGMRFSDTTTTTAYGLHTSSRLPVGKRWRFYPRLRIDRQNWKDSAQSQVSIAPIIRVEYSWEMAHFEIELGSEWIKRSLPDTNEEINSTYGSIGYRLEF